MRENGDNLIVRSMAVSIFECFPRESGESYTNGKISSCRIDPMIGNPTAKAPILSLPPKSKLFFVIPNK